MSYWDDTHDWGLELVPQNLECAVSKGQITLEAAQRWPRPLQLLLQVHILCVDLRRPPGREGLLHVALLPVTSACVRLGKARAAVAGRAFAWPR